MDPIALPMSNFYGPRLDKQNRFPYFNQGDPRCSTRLRGHFPSLKMKYNTTMVWARGFGINQELSQGVGGVYLQPLRHTRGKRIVISLNELWGT
ncbi:hypothetical protein TNCV_3606521 [Trichonephila clavipes]|nr:hypothetical protein TNCV_3606521 [Trichonephila clavipes]